MSQNTTDHNPWYKRLLCGWNKIGDFADWVNRGTEIQYPVTPLDAGRGFIETRCWCCTFWRGVVIGGLLGVVAAGLFMLLFL